MACETPEHSFSPIVGHVSLCRGWVFLQILVATNYAEVVAGGMFGWFVPQPANEGGLTSGSELHCGGLLGGILLQAEFIYKHVEGAKSVAGTGMGSVGIHDHVSNVRGPNDALFQLW